MFKDNHRPVIPTLIDQSGFLPPVNNEPIRVNIASTPGVPLTNMSVLNVGVVNP